MRILVTGAAGFVGKHVCLELVQRGHEVVAADMFLDRLYSNEQKIENWKELGKLANVELLDIDLRGDISILGTDYDGIVNEAGMPGLMKSWSDFETYISCNVSVVENILRNIVKISKPHLVQISTSSVYGKEATGSEDSSLEPISPYGVSKLAAEELVRAYERSFGIQYTILRYFSVYGPGQRPDMAYHKIINSILNGKEITIYGDGSQSRTNTYVTDCARATVQALENGPYNDVFNIAGSESQTLLDAVHAIEELSGHKAKIKYADSRPGDQKVTRGITDKAHNTFGYTPAMPFLEGIASQIKWQSKTRT